MCENKAKRIQAKNFSVAKNQAKELRKKREIAGKRQDNQDEGYSFWIALHGRTPETYSVRCMRA